ncbi:MAG: nuclear transport factor 2 family protein [bacterium]|nr:nuclear transport factor 2 family protein [bacterium]
MYEKLLSLEKDFFRYKKITDKNWLDSVLHDNFMEMGKSGTLFYKEETITDLMSVKADRDIDIYNFEAAELKPDCWIVHYITKSDDKLFYRTSVWIKENNMKLIFHQASACNEKAPLQLC